MPLLDNTPTLIEKKREALLNGPRALFNNMFQQWRVQFLMLWDNDNPAEILEALGTNAVELFTLSAQMVVFLETLKPGCTADLLTKMLPCTLHEDGTVTINE